MTASPRPWADVRGADLIAAAVAGAASVALTFAAAPRSSSVVPEQHERVSVSIRDDAVTADGITSAPSAPERPRRSGRKARTRTRARTPEPSPDPAADPVPDAPPPAVPPRSAKSAGTLPASPSAPVAGPEPSSSDPAADPESGESDAPAADGGGGSSSAEGPGDDPAAGRGGDGEVSPAVARYRNQLRQWLALRFSVTGTGLPAAVLTTRRINATLEVDPDGTVVEVSLKPTGNAAFDAAAEQSLQALRGQRLPAPPEDYPGPLQRMIKITFVCPIGACT